MTIVAEQKFASNKCSKLNKPLDHSFLKIAPQQISIKSPNSKDKTPAIRVNAIEVQE